MKARLPSASERRLGALHNLKTETVDNNARLQIGRALSMQSAVVVYGTRTSTFWRHFPPAALKTATSTVCLPETSGKVLTIKLSCGESNSPSFGDRKSTRL